jgi:hypothetical protein
MELTAFAAARLTAFAARAGLRKHARAVEEPRRCADRAVGFQARIAALIQKVPL